MYACVDLRASVFLCSMCVRVVDARVGSVSGAWAGGRVHGLASVVVTRGACGAGVLVRHVRV